MRRFARFFSYTAAVLRGVKHVRFVSCHRCGAFTTVELMVATVVMAFTLLGVYGVFRQSLFVEETVTSRWRDRAEAARVADYIVESIEQTLRLDGIPSLRGGPIEGEQGFELVGVRGGGLFSQADPSRSRLRRYRLVWGLEEESEGLLFLQSIPMAGSVDLGLPASANEGDGLNDTQRWALVTSTVIGEGLARLQVQYRPSDNPDAEWRNRWPGGDRPPLVRIRVRAGDAGGYLAERFVTPFVTETLIQASGEPPRRRVADTTCLFRESYSGDMV